MEVPSYFAKYLQKIQPSSNSRERAIQLHKTLRNRLAESDDEIFSSWYSGSFLYGSYARNTAIQPIKDVDVCLLLDMEIGNYTPEQVVHRLKNVLEDLGYEDKTAYQRRSIRIDMSGTTMDAVPVVPVDGEDAALRIPDRKLKEWVYTHPKAHIEAATRINADCGGRYIPLVKIVKAWYRYQAKEKRDIERPKPKGFTLEALVANYQDPDAPTYAEAFINFLQNLMDACGLSLHADKFPQIPDPGLPGEYLKVSFEPDEIKLFVGIIEESLPLAKRALTAETYGESADLWREIFGNRFPAAPAGTRSMGMSEAVEDEYSIFDPLIEAEISEIQLPTRSGTMGKLTLKAGLSHQQRGHIYQNYPSGSRAVAKNIWIRFSIADTSITEPYQIKWIVENHGKEAREANDMGHWHMTTSREPYYWKTTKYRGTHYLICEIIKSSSVVARARYSVNVR